jgi:hypothetical protein
VRDGSSGNLKFKSFFIPQKVALVAMDSGQEFGPGYRQLLYGGLSLVMVSFIWSSSAGNNHILRITSS